MPKLDPFTQAYIECALWSTNDDDGTPLDKKHDIENLAPETLQTIILDCQKFQQENEQDIDGEDVQAGHDFWLTRNGHGAGFWDGDWPKESGERLTNAAHKFGEVYLHLGDDGLIYS